MCPRRDLTAALIRALHTGCAIAPAVTSAGNRTEPPVCEQDQCLGAPVASVAPVARAPDLPDEPATERVTAVGAVDMPAGRPAAQHRAIVAGLLAAALLRPSSWSDPAAIPSPGVSCSACGGRRFWPRAAPSRGWCCAACHPPDRLPAAAILGRST